MTGMADCKQKQLLTSLRSHLLKRTLLQLVTGLRQVPLKEVNNIHCTLYLQSISSILLFREKQLIESRKEFLDLYHHFQKQLSGLSETFATSVGYLLRDMASGFPDENPYGVCICKIQKTPDIGLTLAQSQTEIANVLWVYR